MFNQYGRTDVKDFGSLICSAQLRITAHNCYRDLVKIEAHNFLNVFFRCSWTPPEPINHPPMTLIIFHINPFTIVDLALDCGLHSTPFPPVAYFPTFLCSHSVACRKSSAAFLVIPDDQRPPANTRLLRTYSYCISITKQDDSDSVTTL